MLLHTCVIAPPIPCEAGFSPSKQPLGRSTLNFGEAILPGMRDDVRLGTNLKGCIPTCGLLNQL